jgi:hypothetical protein
LELPTIVEEELAARGDGSIDLRGSHRARGGPGSPDTPRLKWSAAKAGARGFVDLCQALGRHDWAVAYGYAEVHSVHARETVLRCGSDDGIKLWLNGQLVHHNEVGRTYAPGSDEVAVYLQAGVNRLLVKIDNYTRNWGFGLAVPKAVS